MAFREIGKGYHSLCTFASNMNMISPIARKSYDSISEKLHDAYETVAEQSTTNAAKETAIALGCDPNNTTDCQISVDGTWQ